MKDDYYQTAFKRMFAVSEQSMHLSAARMDAISKRKRRQARKASTIQSALAGMRVRS